MNENKKMKLNVIGEFLFIDNKYYINLEKEYIDGLKYLSTFSHAIIIYTENKYNNMSELNLLEKIVKILHVDEKRGNIQVEWHIPMSSFVKIYDIKPYFPCEDRVNEYQLPENYNSTTAWYDETEQIECDVNTISKIASDEVISIGDITKQNAEYYININKDNYHILDKLQGFSHIKIFWWFHKFDKSIYRSHLECQPPYENSPKTGVFATRSPVRPNPIALTTAKILEIDKYNKRVKVTNLDCFNNTPLIGIIPYIPKYDRVKNFFLPTWLEHWPQWLDDSNKEINEPIRIKPSSIDLIRKYHNKMISSHKKDDILKKESNLITKHKVHNSILVKGARQNNLKNVDVTVPYNKITVMTGVSGSGKTSLAFDTIYAESQRRFIDSLGGNQAIGEQMEKPDFDSIDGIIPSVSVSQKSIGRNPRSTVGTMTGMYDVLRNLYTSIGIRHCPNCGEAIIPMTTDEIIDILSEFPVKLEIAPFGGENIYDEDLSNRIRTGLKLGKGAITVTFDNIEEITFQTTQMCYYCNNIMFELSPTTFSFNNPESMCPNCGGYGMSMKVNVNMIVTKPSISILDGASEWWGKLRAFKKNSNANWMKGEILALADDMGIDLEMAWDSLPEEFRKQALFGSNDKKVTFTYENKNNGRTGTISRPVEGAYNCINRLFNENNGDSAKNILSKFMTQSICEHCQCERLSREGRAVTVVDTRFPLTVAMTISELKTWCEDLIDKLTKQELSIAKPILNQLYKSLCLCIKAGLSYLTLDRSIPTLSGGELQRLKLITQLGGSISNILYVLDEPSAGLHPKDNQMLIETIRELRNNNNTVIIVEHDADIILSADHIIDVGPAAGEFGGNIIFEGTIDTIMQNENSDTGKYLSGKKKIETGIKSDLRKSNWVNITGIRCNNLKNINITFPTNAITCVSGVSGSGKSSLVTRSIYPAIQNKLDGKIDTSAYCDLIHGAEYFDKIIYVNQNPIGRTPRSNPATYTGLMDEIRNIFGSIKKTKEKGYGASHFSFNNKDGQCEVCHGDGKICTPVTFMADIWTVCPICKGRRYKKEILDIEYNSKNIYDILEMTISEALFFFFDNIKIINILQILDSVGLGYLKLGQSATTLSGGEAQRIKLAKELSVKNTGHTLYLLDEPTTGLHFSDVENLMILLRKITDLGNSVLIIEHNVDILKNADWIIDLGPEGGSGGGYVVAQGKLKDIIIAEKSYTGKYLI